MASLKKHLKFMVKKEKKKKNLFVGTEKYKQNKNS